MIEYLATHELAHLLQPHHHKAFWDIVERILPDYEEGKRWLAENGASYDL